MTNNKGGENSVIT